MREKAALGAVDELRDKLDSHRPLTPDLERTIRAWLVPSYLYSSAALGQKDHLSQEETETFLERDIVAGGHPLDRFLAIERHLAAYELIEKRAREGGQLDLGFVRQLHHTLLDGARRRVTPPSPGRWKTSESPAQRRRGRTFSYASPEQVPELMEKLLAEFQQRREQDHPLLAATWLYYHFHLIHPFDEENGRVGRLLASCFLLHLRYPPLIVDPGQLPDYMDALTACDSSVPPADHAPLSPKLTVSPLLDLFSESLSRTASRMLDFIEGREVAGEGLASKVAQDQDRLLGEMVKAPGINWRVKGGFEVRALHSRLEGLARQLVVDGSLYSIGLEEAEVVPRHRLSGSKLGSSLPMADAGVVGILTLVISGDETAGNLRFPAPMRLQLAAAGTKVSSHVALHWQGEEKIESHTGPLRASAWPQATLTKLLTHAVDERRRRFELMLLDANLSGEAQSTIRAALKLKPGEAVKVGRVARGVRREHVPQDMRKELRPLTTATRRPGVTRGLCPGCHKVPSGASLTCPDCETTYHEDCLTKLGRCVTDACLGRSSDMGAVEVVAPRTKSKMRIPGVKPTEPPLSF